MRGCKSQRNSNLWGRIRDDQLNRKEFKKENIYKKMKRGISPVIATVLFIAMVVVIGLIVFLWFRGMIEESITKFEGTNIELVCEDVAFEASYSGGTLFIANKANVPIYGMKIKIFRDGSHTTEDIAGNWPASGLNHGGTFSDNLDIGDAEKIIIIPVLIGTSEKGEKTFMCDERRYGYEIAFND